MVLALVALVALATLLLWLAGEQRAAHPPSAPDSTALEDEVKRLRRENAELREMLDRRSRPRSRAETRPPDPDGATSARVPAPQVPAGDVSLGGLGRVAGGQAPTPADALGAGPPAGPVERAPTAGG